MSDATLRLISVFLVLSTGALGCDPASRGVTANREGEPTSRAPTVFTSKTVPSPLCVGASSNMKLDSPREPSSRFAVAEDTKTQVFVEVRRMGGTTTAIEVKEPTWISVPDLGWVCAYKRPFESVAVADGKRSLNHAIECELPGVAAMSFSLACPLLSEDLSIELKRSGKKWLAELVALWKPGEDARTFVSMLCKTRTAK